MDNENIFKRCELCNGDLVPLKIQYHDLSGWLYGYSCDCNFDTRSHTSQLVIWSDKDITEEFQKEIEKRKK